MSTRMVLDSLLLGVLTNRAGWGIAMMTGQELSGITHGPLPGHQQSIPRAELHAVVQVLRQRIVPMHIRTDCLGIVDGPMKGAAWRAHPRRPNSDLWRQLLRAVDGHGGLSPRLDASLARSHQTQGEATPDKKGNDYADVAAKMRLATHAPPSE
eukprot:8779354-Pyramimonas_sp.AAC.1